METRGDVLLKNKELFKRWKGLGLEYMFLGLEAIDAEGLKAFRKRVPLGKNFEALEYARSLGIVVAVNIIADPDWDEARFKVIQEWALSVPAEDQHRARPKNCSRRQERPPRKRIGVGVPVVPVVIERPAGLEELRGFRVAHSEAEGCIVLDRLPLFSLLSPSHARCCPLWLRLRW